MNLTLRTAAPALTPCPCCARGLVACESCDGAGSVEYSTDHFEPREGHYTREHTEACDACEGTGRVFCRACDSTGVHPLVSTLLLAGRFAFARREALGALAGALAPVPAMNSNDARGAVVAA